MKRAIIILIISFLLQLSIVNASQDEVLNMTKRAFLNNVPVEYQKEYVFMGIEKRGENTYFALWGRFINNVPVENNFFSVLINSSNENIIEKSFTHDDLHSDLDTTPSLSKNQATWLITKTYGGRLLNATESDVVEAFGNPFLLIKGKDLVWATFLDLNPIDGIELLELAVDADTGETVHFNPPLSLNVRRLSTHFNPINYLWDRYAFILIFLLSLPPLAIVFYKKGVLLLKRQLNDLEKKAKC